MNRRELRVAVRNRLGLPETGSARLLEPQQNDNLNEAVRRLSLEKRWPWLLTSVAMQWPSLADDPVPTDFIAPRILLVTNGGVDTEARYVDLQVFLQTPRTQPWWTMVGRNARLAPTPTTTVNGTLFYYRAEPDLSTDTSEPLAPAYAHDAIVHYASHLGHLNLQNPSGAADELALYNQLVTLLDDRARSGPSGQRVRTQDELTSVYASWT